MTDKTRKAFNNAIANARMEGFDFTDEQLNELAYFIEQVYDKDDLARSHRLSC